MTVAAAPTPTTFLGKLSAQRGMILPIALITLLLVILVPLPTQILDFLLIVNITLSVIVLVTTLYIKSPLELAVFPSLLLAMTLFRLVLNVATTRLILTSGDGGKTTAQALHSAGEVVLTFAAFVTGGSLTVGIIIFLIIFIIQFIVITKGGGRISEVAARFTLDAMPGKQMAIDADLNAGTINEAQARQRREDIARQADFYGAMDGASKFVRGDAIAAIIITAVNILGGIYVGMVEHSWEIGPTLKLFTILTIGDGLVSQVPAFITSLAAGLIVTRASDKKDLGEEVAAQLFASPNALVVASGFLAFLTVTGLPIFPLLIMSGACAYGAYFLNRKTKTAAAATVKAEKEKTQKKEPEEPRKLLDMDTMELEVGYGLVRLVDARKGGDLLDRINLVRKQLAVELGIIVPPIRIRDSMNLGANDYAIKIKGNAVAKGVTYPEQFLAMNSGAVTGPIPGGTVTTEPAFGLPAYWITESQKHQAEVMNYTVVEAPAVLATHLTETVKNFAHELLTRQEVKNLIEGLKARLPALVEEVIPTQVKPGELQKVLQNLLRERVAIRDLETILEACGDCSARTKDVDVMTEHTRNAISRSICKQYVDEQEKLWCITLDPTLEDLIIQHLERSERGTTNTMPPKTAQQVVQRIADKVAELTNIGRPAVVLCAPLVRSSVRRMIEGSMPTVAVLAYNEISSGVSVEAVAMAGLSG